MHNSFPKEEANSMLHAPICEQRASLLVTKGIATNGARTLLLAPGITTSNKKLLGTNRGGQGQSFFRRFRAHKGV